MLIQGKVEGVVGYFEILSFQKNLLRTTPQNFGEYFSENREKRRKLGQFDLI